MNGKRVYTKKLKSADTGKTFHHTVERDFIPDAVPKETIHEFDVVVPGDVTPPPPPPPVECPEGQHWSETEQKCVDNTTPPPPPPTGNIFRIGHCGDTHGDHKAVEMMVTRDKVDFVLHSGDASDDEQTDDGYVDTVQKLGLVYSVSVANSQGNHESAEEGGEEAQADFEAAFPILKETRWLQFYHVANVCIIINNTQISGYSQLDSVASKHVMDSLTKAKGLVDEGKADWIFFMQHKPMYTMQGGHDPEYNFRYNHHAAMDAAGVDIWVSGHVHNEQRTKPLIFGGEGTNVPPKTNDKMIGDAHDFTTVPHGVVCCQNGSSTKSHSLGEDLNAWTVWAEDNGDSYTVFEIDGKNLTGKFVDIDSGDVRHAFHITKGEATPPPPPPPQECPEGQHWDEQQQKCVDDTVTPPPPPPPTGEVDEFGTKLLAKVTGKNVALEVGSNHRNGQRYNVNHRFLNYMGLGYLKTSPDQNKLSCKLDGVNHGSCTQLPKCCWMDTEINLDTTRAALGAEYPHPDNHDAPSPSAKNLGVNTQDKWVGWGTLNWTTPEGWRRHQLWISTDPFDAQGKPKNNFQLVMDETDTGQITTPELAKRKIPIDQDDGLEYEIRMQNAGGGGHGDTTDMKWFKVHEIIPPT